MTGFFAIVGMVACGLLALLIALVIAYLIYGLIGYIYGAFRLRRLGGVKADEPWWTLVRYGYKNWLKGGGWYITLGSDKVYLNGFRKIEQDDWIGA